MKYSTFAKNVPTNWQEGVFDGWLFHVIGKKDQLCSFFISKDHIVDEADFDRKAGECLRQAMLLLHRKNLKRKKR